MRSETLYKWDGREDIETFAEKKIVRQIERISKEEEI